jgi:N-ethylmaleimide reductase
MTASTTPHLLAAAHLGPLALRNHLVMAPMTRSRAQADGVPGELAATYYAQRATAGLIVTEATNISTDAIGSPGTPGLYTDAQVQGWQRITAAVHGAGGRIFAQLWHTGRVGHSAVRGGVLPVAPSAIAITGQQHFIGSGMRDYEVPRALTSAEVKATVADYRAAAVCAQGAGFDGVELHGAFGYLPNQFLVDSANQRSDEYGGTITNRCRFVIEVMQALIDVWGAERVGIKLSPVSSYNGMVDSDPVALFSHLIEALDRLRPAYVHLMNASLPEGAHPTWPRDVLATFGHLTHSAVIANGGYDAAKAEAELASGRAQLVSFGSLYVANPDLAARIDAGAPLAKLDPATLYGGGAHGYTDYPAWSA